MKTKLCLLTVLAANVIVGQNIGINTELPLSTLDINGDLRVSDLNLLNDSDEILVINKDNVVSKIRKSALKVSPEFVKANETITVLEDTQKGTYTYTSEDDTKTVINVPAAVAANFETILKNPDVNNAILDLFKNVGGNVFYDGNKLEYADNNGVKYEIELKQYETITTLTKDTALSTYTYLSENKTRTVIDIVGDVQSNFDKIANSPEVKKIIEKISKEATGNVIYDGTSFTYKDSGGTTRTIDMSKIVKDNETESRLVDNDDGTYTYYSEKAIDANGNPIKSKGVSFTIPTAKTYLMSHIEKYDSKKAKSYKFSYKTIVNTLQPGANYIYNVSKTYDFTKPYYNVLFDANSNPVDTKFVQVAFNSSFYTALNNNVVLKKGVWFEFEVRFLVNGDKVFSQWFTLNWASNGAGTVEFNLSKSFALENIELKKSGNLFEVAIIPKQSLFSTNEGTGDGQYNSNNAEFLTIRMKDLSFQLFEK